MDKRVPGFVAAILMLEIAFGGAELIVCAMVAEPQLRIKQLNANF